MLLGQIKAMSKRGMFAAFIDFRKAYDRVDRAKMWQCLEGTGFSGRVIDLIRATYKDLSGEVKVGEVLSKPFGITPRLCLSHPCSSYTSTHWWRS